MVHLKSGKSRGFLWSLNPMVIWMRFIGIELNCSTKRSNWHRTAAAGLSLLLLMFNSLVNVTQLIAIVRKTPSSVWVDVLKEVNVALYPVAIHSAFLMAIRSHWSKLFDTMEQIERSFAFNRLILYKACRKVSIAGMVFLTVVKSKELTFKS